jgi:thiamine biosynthesis lipoprotein
MNDALPTMRAFEAMGTRFECVLTAFNRPVRATEAVAVAEEVEFIVRDWHRRLSVFDPGSAVATVNDLAHERPVSVDAALFDLLDRCLSHTRDTRGRFDIAVGSLMRAHGFRAGSADRPVWGSDLVRLDPGASTVRFTEAGVALDLGAIAKGFVLDLVAAELADLGVTGALVHGGSSSVLAVGRPPGGRPWRVKAMPRDPIAPVIELEDAAMSVSAPSGRVHEGKGHIMDPVSGQPADGIEAACVTGPSSEVCEAWSTALVIDPSLAASVPDGYGCFLRAGSAWRSSGTPAVCCSGVC